MLFGRHRKRTVSSFPAGRQAGRQAKQGTFRSLRLPSAMFFPLCPARRQDFYLAPKITDCKLSAFCKVSKTHSLLRFGRQENALSPPSCAQTKVRFVRSTCPALLSFLGTPKGVLESIANTRSPRSRPQSKARFLRSGCSAHFFFVGAVGAVPEDYFEAQKLTSSGSASLPLPGRKARYVACAETARVSFLRRCTFRRRLLVEEAKKLQQRAHVR